jgi:hypothetical protein
MSVGTKYRQVVLAVAVIVARYYSIGADAEDFRTGCL